MKHELDAYRAINDFKTTASEARRARIVIWIMGSACAVAFGMVLATSAYGHEAIPTAAKPQGWSYSVAGAADSRTICLFVPPRSY